MPDLRSGRLDLPRGQLEHPGGAAARQPDPPGLEPHHAIDHHALVVEGHHVDGEAHPAGVDAAARHDPERLAGRDEATATTKIFALADDGGCTEVVDLKAPTGKVAWDPEARRVAFAIPEGAVRDGSGVVWLGRTDRERAGMYVFDRRVSSAERVEASMDARRLTFPEWVGKDQVVFLLPPEGRGGSGRFRLVCCLP